MYLILPANTAFSHSLMRMIVSHGVLFRNDVENTGTACSTKTSNSLFFVYAVGTKEFANACVVRILGRPNRKYTAETTTQTLTAGNYAKIAARPKSPYQRFVSSCCDYNASCYLLSYSFNVVLSGNFHSVNPFAFLPITIMAAAEELENR